MERDLFSGRNVQFFAIGSRNHFGKIFESCKFFRYFSQEPAQVFSSFLIEEDAQNRKSVWKISCI